MLSLRQLVFRFFTTFSFNLVMCMVWLLLLIIASNENSFVGIVACIICALNQFTLFVDAYVINFISNRNRLYVLSISILLDKLKSILGEDKILEILNECQEETNEAIKEINK